MSNTLPNLPKLLKSANGSFTNGNGVKSGNTYNLKTEYRNSNWRQKKVEKQSSKRLLMV